MHHYLSFSPEQSFTLWDKWEVRGNKGFKLQDFLAAVKVSFLESLPSAKSELVLYYAAVTLVDQFTQSVPWGGGRG